MQQCNFWDFGNNRCRLYSDNGPEEEPNQDEHYEFGVKHCEYGMFTIIMLLPSVLFMIKITHVFLISKVTYIFRYFPSKFA